MKKGFTLAEVIITILIIGVISALTIPTVITNYQKRQTITGLQKSYNTFNQIINSAIKDKGPISNWKLNSDTQVFEDYFKPYIKTLTKSYNCPNYCRYMYNSLNGSSGYFSYNNTHYLIDRTVFSLTVYGGYIVIYVDINGTKKPNIFGKDIFTFIIYSYYRYAKASEKYKLLPYGANWTRQELLGETYGACTKSQSVDSAGLSCAAIIIKDGWQIKDDYPW